MSNETRQIFIAVDAARCQGHNRCQVLLPDLIAVDDHGFAHAKGRGAVPPERLEQARLAVKNCPEFALRLRTASEPETRS